jgi:NitT/TauT family transport system substrate-binding protein
LTLRLGFIASITQAPALAGVREGFFGTSLAPRVALRAVPFTSDSAEAAALATGKLDAAYASPTTIMALNRTHPASIRIISGAVSGGSEFITSRHVHTPDQLKDAILADPAVNGDQDIALRYWLHRHDLSTTGPGHVTVTAIASGAATLTAFKNGRITGAWVAAPYDTEMLKAGGRVLAAQASQYPVTNLIVRSAFLAHHTAAVLDLLKGQVQANDYFRHSLVQAVLAATTELKTLTHARIPTSILDASLAQITYTNDPNAASLAAETRQAAELGIPHPADSITALYDLVPLNLILREAGEPPVTP